MEPLTPEQLARLPLYAQRYIAYLTQRAEAAENTLRALAVTPDRADVLWMMEWVGQQGAIPPRATVRLKTDFNEYVDFHLIENGVSVQASTEVGIYPGAANSFIVRPRRRFAGGSEDR